MTANDIIKMRLGNQQLSKPLFTDPADVVRWLGAVQSQDYAAGKWGLACRLQKITDDEINRAFDAGCILRTHVLRPTWHFVLPEDIRWMIELTEPRISAFSAKYFSDLELDKSLFKRSNRIIVKALEAGEYLTKKEIGEALQKGKIDTTDLRLTYIIIRAELDRLICSGPRRGKQVTYGLLDHRAPKARVLKRDEALTELAKRYFNSRGPATAQDFAWWSGLSAVDSRKAIEIINAGLLKEAIDGQTYYYASNSKVSDTKKGTQVHLLPSWDEYAVAYKDRRLLIDPQFEDQAGHGIFSPIAVVNGKIKGTWRRELKANAVKVEVRYFADPIESSREKMTATARLYARYLKKDLILKQVTAGRL
jgi:hypothetical protein